MNKEEEWRKGTLRGVRILLGLGLLALYLWLSCCLSGLGGLLLGLGGLVCHHESLVDGLLGLSLRIVDLLFVIAETTPGFSESFHELSV